MVGEVESPVKKPKSFNRRPWTDMETPRIDGPIVIQPDEADYVLKTWNTGNRGYSKTTENVIAHELRSGRWRVNGETIIFATGPLLIDGQHRFGACAATKIPLETYVVFGAPPDVFSTIDRGKKRGLGDDLSIIKEKHANTLAATVTILWHEEAGKVGKVGRLPSPPLDVAQKILAESPNLRAFVAWASLNRNRCPLIPSVIAFCYYQFSQKDAAAADKFFEDLAEGAYLRPGDPVKMLREKLLQRRAVEKSSGSRISQAEAIAIVRKAWNYRRKDVVGSIKDRQLVWRPIGNQTEAFPAIL
jgi:hypothetical protein